MTTPMTENERDAALAIALLAALADGQDGPAERAELQRIAAALDPAAEGRLGPLLDDLRSGQRTLESAAGAFQTAETRQAAFELAVGVCNADGSASPAEAAFLEKLRGVLRLGDDASAFARDAGAMMALPAAGASSGAAGGPSTPAQQPRPAPDGAALDKQILDAAILNGALELLPQRLATLAVIPLQLRLVYKIGQAHGYELDAGHLKDFAATAGVGLASQYVERAGRALMGGLLRGMLGKMVGGVASMATGSAMSFATTYALGQVAKRYYGGGRTLTPEALREAFQAVLADGKALQEKYGGAIQEKAKTVDVSKLVGLVRGETR